jgi:hypothetical protein
MQAYELWNGEVRLDNNPISRSGRAVQLDGVDQGTKLDWTAVVILGLIESQPATIALKGPKLEVVLQGDETSMFIKSSEYENMSVTC